MKHQVSKVKFRAGKDANKMLIKKLVYNFFSHGSLVTTAAKAKTLKMFVERLVEKTKEETTANKNYMLRYINSKDLLKHLYANVGPVVKDVRGGYVRIEKLHQRMSDGSPMARVSWAYPIVNGSATETAAPVKKTEKAKVTPVEEPAS